MGVTFYELLTGDRPVGAWQPASQINPTVPPVFDQILSRLLARRSENRYPDIYEVLAAASVLKPLGTKPVLRPLRTTPKPEPRSELAPVPDTIALAEPLPEKQDAGASLPNQTPTGPRLAREVEVGTCPNCGTRALPSADGTCPACRATNPIARYHAKDDKPAIGTATDDESAVEPATDDKPAVDPATDLQDYLRQHVGETRPWLREHPRGMTPLEERDLILRNRSVANVISMVTFVSGLFLVLLALMIAQDFAVWACLLVLVGAVMFGIAFHPDRKKRRLDELNVMLASQLQSPITPRGGSATTVPSSAAEAAAHPVVEEVPSPDHGNADVALEPSPLDSAPNCVQTPTTDVTEPNGTPAPVASTPTAGLEKSHPPLPPPPPSAFWAALARTRSWIAVVLRSTLAETKAICIGTLTHVMLVVRLAVLLWRSHLLQEKFNGARRYLGQKMCQQHVGDQTILTQIAELTVRIESPEPIDIGTLNRLKRDRRQLTLRLADLALAQDNSPTGLEVEHQEVVGIQAAIEAHQDKIAASTTRLRPSDPASSQRIGIGYAMIGTLIVLAIVWALPPHRASDTTASVPPSSDTVASAIQRSEAQGRT